MQKQRADPKVASGNAKLNRFCQTCGRVTIFKCDETSTWYLRWFSERRANMVHHPERLEGQCCPLKFDKINPNLKWIQLIYVEICIFSRKSHADTACSKSCSDLELHSRAHVTPRKLWMLCFLSLVVNSGQASHATALVLPRRKPGRWHAIMAVFSGSSLVFFYSLYFVVNT